MDAEQILEAAIAVAEATHGRDSLEHGEAWFQLASLLAGMGDHERGIDALQTALDLDLPGEDGQRDQRPREVEWTPEVPEFPQPKPHDLVDGRSFVERDIEEKEPQFMGLFIYIALYLWVY